MSPQVLSISQTVTRMLSLFTQYLQHFDRADGLTSSAVTSCVSESMRSRRLPPAPTRCSLRQRLGNTGCIALAVTPASLLWIFRTKFQVGMFHYISSPEPGEGRAEGPQEVQACRPGSHPPVGCP